MFSPAPMLQLRALVLERDAREVLLDWGEAGVVQLTHSKPGPDTLPLAPRDCTGELTQCHVLLTRAAELRRQLEAFSVSPRPNDFPSDAMDVGTLAAADQQLQRLEAQAGEWLQRHQQLIRRIAELESTCERLTPYRELDLPLGGADQFTFLHFATGSLPAGNWPELQRQIAANAALLPLPEQHERQPLVVMAAQRHWPAIEHALLQTGFQPETLPEVAGTSTDSLAARSQRERESLVAELQTVNAGLQTLAARCFVPLARIEHLAGNERQLIEAGLHFPRTEAAVLLAGWIVANDADRVRTRLLTITQGCCVVNTVTPANLPAKDVPVSLHHPAWLRPFAKLVCAYGLPKYDEVEPTLFVAVSFLLMFGMMFGDVGHGAVLALGGLVAWLAARSPKLHDVGLLLLFGGLSSIGFGCIYGSCFGLESFKRFALWHDPLEGDPVSLMRGAIGFGVGLLGLGLGLNVINRLRRHDFLGGLLDHFGLAGLLFYGSTLALFLKPEAVESHGLLFTTMLAAPGLALVGWTLKKPLEFLAHQRIRGEAEQADGLFAVITESLVGVFEAVLSYLANTISFVRLAAYAMSHAALLAAVFAVAAQMRDVTVGGGILAILVIVGGNLVAIALEGMIASVQALRLEYYEFFSKFFAGDGRPFTPFRLVSTQSTQ